MKLKIKYITIGIALLIFTGCGIFGSNNDDHHHNKRLNGFWVLRVSNTNGTYIDYLDIDYPVVQQCSETGIAGAQKNSFKLKATRGHNYQLKFKLEGTNEYSDKTSGIRIDWFGHDAFKVNQMPKGKFRRHSNTKAVKTRFQECLNNATYKTFVP